MKEGMKGKGKGAGGGKQSGQERGGTFRVFSKFLKTDGDSKGATRDLFCSPWDPLTPGFYPGSRRYA